MKGIKILVFIFTVMIINTMFPTYLYSFSESDLDEIPVDLYMNNLSVDSGISIYLSETSTDMYLNLFDILEGYGIKKYKIDENGNLNFWFEGDRDQVNLNFLILKGKK